MSDATTAIPTPASARLAHWWIDQQLRCCDRNEELGLLRGDGEQVETARGWRERLLIGRQHITELVEQHRQKQQQQQPAKD